ncbi:uncharacterized protein [Coffea arabica]|uniref:Uncharacterized protein n=1 Tax=Coffea arabica TaxID=13443 RepID=A0ABM4VUC9_COFAR
MAKWQMILFEFDIIFTTQKAIKGQVIADHLAENSREDDYQPLHTYFYDEEILFVGTFEDMNESYLGWKLFFDGASNSFGVGIEAVLESLERNHHPTTAKLRFSCTNNMAKYETCIFGLKMALEMEIKDLIVFNKLAIEPIHIQLKEKLVHCLVVEKASECHPWYSDIKEFIKTGSYPPGTDSSTKNFLHRMLSKFFLSGGMLYKKTLDLGLLRCIDREEADYNERGAERTSIGATPYSLLHGMEAVLPAEIEIPFLRILMEIQLEEVKWVKQRHE